MGYHNIFLSVVLVSENGEDIIGALLEKYVEILKTLVQDFEIIIVDNASNDSTVGKLRELTSEHGIPNLQVYALTKQVSVDVAMWVGVENALGDFVCTIDSKEDELSFLPKMLEHSSEGCDVVFAKNTYEAKYDFSYSLSRGVFDKLYRSLTGLNIRYDAPRFRVISKKVINYILQHNKPELAFTHLPVTGGFVRKNLSYRAESVSGISKGFLSSLDKATKLIVSTTRAPMRMVTFLSIFGALANLVYSVYILFVALFKDDVAPGWVSLSLQQSGMFFLISLVLLILGEYILHMASLSNEAPEYHVGQEYTSVRLTRKEKLNIEE